MAPGWTWPRQASGSTSWVSVRVSLELRVLDADGKLLAKERQAAIALHTTPDAAAESAAREAVVCVAERLLPALAKGN